jgi:hypothetical protein
MYMDAKEPLDVPIENETSPTSSSSEEGSETSSPSSSSPSSSEEGSDISSPSSSENQSETSPPFADENPDSITLKLGDIIDFVAPSNPDLHKTTCLIDYIDNTTMVVINIDTNKKTTLSLDDDGSLTDKSVRSILLLDRSEQEGYAVQNGLLPHTWLDIYIGGDTPAVITGEITNLDEDMIEVITFPDRNTIYIDFGYKGIPLDIPFTQFRIRAKPVLAPAGDLTPASEEGVEEESVSTASVENTPNGEMIISVEEDAVPDEDISDVLHAMYLDANEIVFGDELEELVQLVELPESQRKYGIEQQANDMMDELLSVVPNYKRTEQVLNNIHLLIERFKQLRKRFSRFDENQNVVGFVKHGILHKPLTEKIRQLNTKLRWMVPVVQQKRKVYFPISDDDERFADVISSDVRDELKAAEEIVKQRSTYATTFASLDKLGRPMTADETDNTFNASVLCDLDAIVDNLGQFQSSIFTTGFMDQRKYVIQRYNLGLTKKENIVLKSGKTIYVRNQMTPNDDIAIKSVVLFPEPVMNFSKIDLPATDIMTRASLNHNYVSLFRLLTKKTTVHRHTITNFDNEFPYVDDDEHDNMSFATEIKQFDLDEGIANNTDKFRKFLNVVIPKNKIVFQVMRKYIRNKMSLIEVVRELEPFFVYADDITYNQFKDIRYFIKHQIVELHKKTAERSEKFRSISGINTTRHYTHGFVDNAFNADPEYTNLYESGYKMSDKSVSEMVYKVLTKDNATMLSDAIVSHAAKTLVVPDSLVFEPALIDDTVIVKPKDCVRRYLTKRYSKISDLQADNNKGDIYCDKELDDTPYDLLDAHGREKKTMSADIFKEYLTETLIRKHNAPSDYAVELAETLIAGRRAVRDGEFAVLEIKDTKTAYYRRVKDHWVHDKDVEDIAFIDTNTLFCNLQTDCFKNQNTSVCEPMPNAKKRMDELTKARMTKEFENRVDMSLEQLSENIQQRMEKDHKQLVRQNALSSIQDCRFSIYAFEMGKMGVDSDTIVSPSVALRDLIMGQSDFVKKQSDILQFAETFTREPMTAEMKEDEQWLYCRDTNTKLLPQSIFRLANAFITGDYSRTLDELCASHGTISDDGDAVVDKHSGYVLRKIDFVTEDGFIDGFKVVSHDVIEKDLDVRLTEMFSTKPKPVFENEVNTVIYNVADSICTNMGIPTETVQEFVMRTTLEIVGRNILDAGKYEQQAELLFKTKNKRPIPYEIYKNRMILWSIAAAILVAIQTAIPSFRVKKTYPGCVRSFSGYPMDGGVEDTTGIKYIACVMKKMESPIEPWNSIERLDAAAYAAKIKETVERFFMTRSDIAEKYDEKRKYMAEHPMEIVPEEHSSDKWRSFLPPIVKPNIGSIGTVSKDVEHDLYEQMTRAHKDQYATIQMIKHKCLKQGIGIAEKINDVVKSKDPVLKTASKDPFLENACCNDSSTKPMDYFVKDDPSIQQALVASKHMSELLKIVKQSAKPSVLFHPAFTGLTHLTTASTITEEHIYTAFIRYCNLVNDLPVPHQLLVMCPEKPAGFPANVSVGEQIEFLKKNGKRYSQADLQSLMTLVRNQTLVAYPKNTLFSQIDVIYDLLDRFDKDESKSIDLVFRDNLRAVLSTYKSGIMVAEERDELKKFKNYLASANERMFYEIVKFCDQYGNLSNREFEQFQDFLLEITKTDLTSNDALETMTNFVRNSVYSMTKVFPEMILNGTVFDRIPEHWDLSEKHVGDLQAKFVKFWTGMRSFHGDQVVASVLQNVSTNALDIYLLTQNLPTYSPFVKDGVSYYSVFDATTTHLLYMYLYYSVIYEYTAAANDPNLLRADVEEKKTGRRQVLSEAEKTVGLDDENDALEVEIQMGNTEELKMRVAKVVLMFLDMEKENKANVLSYEQIAKKIRKEKNIEKNKIIEYLGNMDKDERQIEDQFKRYKMGRWNVGLQKGLVHYDKKTYDNETAAEQVDVEQMIEEENKAADAAEDDEALDFSNLDEDYQDGDYYGEDDNDL